MVFSKKADIAWGKRKMWYASAWFRPRKGRAGKSTRNKGREKTGEEETACTDTMEFLAQDRILLTQFNSQLDRDLDNKTDHWLQHQLTVTLRTSTYSKAKKDNKTKNSAAEIRQ